MCSHSTLLSFTLSNPLSWPSRCNSAFMEVLQLCRSALISLADMVLAPSVAGLFKWRQFEPEMILLAVGWYLRFSLSYRDVEESSLLSADFRSTTSPSGDGSSVTCLESTPIATAAPTDQRQLAGGRDLHPGQGQMGVFIPSCRLHRCDDRLPGVG